MLEGDTIPLADRVIFGNPSLAWYDVLVQVDDDIFAL
jgi:hypothetical protein